MNKLTKSQIAERDDIAAKLRSGREDLQAAVDAFNTKRDELYHALSIAITTYNDELSDAFATLSDARDFYNGEVLPLAEEWKNGIASEIEEYIGGRSEKWEESEKGQAVIAWKEAFDELTLEEVEIEDPEYVEFNEASELVIEVEDAADLLEGVPEEAEG